MDGSDAAALKQQGAQCRNVEEFIEALYNPDVSTIWVYASFNMTDADWLQYATPAVLKRDVNVTGIEDDMFKWPVVDLGFTQSKIQVASGFTLVFSRVVLKRWRKGPHFQAPGLDLIATGVEPVERTRASAWAHVRFHNMGWIHRSCLAPSLGQLVSNTTNRPVFVPGRQRSVINVSQEGCSTADGAPLLMRCWPLAVKYDDLCTYGYNMRGYDVVPAGYVLWLQDSFVRCETVLDESCVRQWGSPLGCFYVLFPNADVPTTSTGASGDGASSGAVRSSGGNNGSGGAAASDLSLPPGQWLPADGDGRLDEGDGPQPSLLGPLLAGSLAGAGGTVAVSCLLALILARKRRRHRRAGGGAAARGDIGRKLMEGAEDGGPDAAVAAAAKSESKASGERQPLYWQPEPEACTEACDEGPVGQWDAEVVEAANPAHRLGAVDQERKWGHRRVATTTAAAAAASECGGFPPTGLHFSCTPGFSTGAVPVTPRTPLQPDVNLRVSLGGGELTLLPGVIGKGAFGRVVPGRYAGQPVAVKLLDYGLVMQQSDGGRGSGPGLAAAAAPLPPQRSVIECLDFQSNKGVTASASAKMGVVAVAPVPAAAAVEAVAGAGAASGTGTGETTLSSFAMRPLAERRLPSHLLRVLPAGGGSSSNGGGLFGAAAPAAAAAVTAADASRPVATMACSHGPRGVVVFNRKAHGLAAAKAVHLGDVMERDRQRSDDEVGDRGGGRGGRAGGGLGVNAEDGKHAFWLDTADRRCGLLGSDPDGGMGGAARVGVAGDGIGRGVDDGGSGGGREADGTATAAAVAVAETPPDSRQRALIQEVEVLARIRHRNIVRLLAACTHPPHMCLVMELMETSLDRLLYGKGGGGHGASPLMPLDKVLCIALQMASALEYLHPTIVHRDLKPANVLLQNAASPNPIVKLADFGLSRLQTSVLVTENVEVGTVPYMAPETLNTNNCIVTHHVDIYALGIILWEMLAGLRPWAGLGLVQIAFSVSALCQRPTLELLPPCRCPPKLHSIIQRCWEHVPERRPAAAEVAKELLLVRMRLRMGSETTGMAACASSPGANQTLTDPSWNPSLGKAAVAAAYQRVPYGGAAAAAAVVAAGGGSTSDRCLGRLGPLHPDPALRPAAYRGALPTDLGPA